MPVVMKASGGLAIGFPDVCKLPAPPGPGPVPIPYPSVAKTAIAKQQSKTTAQKTAAATKTTTIKTTVGGVAGMLSQKTLQSAPLKTGPSQVEVDGIKSVMNNLNATLQNMNSNDPDIWQTALGDYAAAAAALYVTKVVVD